MIFALIITGKNILSTKSTIITHQGWADLISCNAIYNHYAAINNELIIFVLDEPRAVMMRDIFSDRPNIKVQVPKFKHFASGETCLICHTYGGSLCPRAGGKCNYIDYSYYEGYNHIKIGGFKNYSVWESHVNHNRGNGLSFSHSFYTMEGLPLDSRIGGFRVARNLDSEHGEYINLEAQIGLNYTVIHEDLIRGYKLKSSIADGVTPIYDLNLKSRNMIDQIKIIENAKELHFIDSNYSVLIYYLSFHNNEIRKIPKFLHASSRPSDRDVSIYTNPTPENWSVI